LSVRFVLCVAELVISHNQSHRDIQFGIGGPVALVIAGIAGVVEAGDLPVHYAIAIAVRLVIVPETLELGFIAGVGVAEIHHDQHAVAHTFRDRVAGIVKQNAGVVPTFAVTGRFPGFKLGFERRGTIRG
jgi:hypothetical protein